MILSQVFATICRRVSQFVAFITSVLKGIFTLTIVLCIITAQLLAPFILRARHAWVRLTTGLALVFLTSLLVYTGYTEWRQTIDETNRCSKGTDFPYMELQFKNQHLRDPEFHGTYYINFADVSVAQMKLTQSELTRAGERKSFVWRPALITLLGNRMMNPNPREEMNFLTHSNSHYMFPFDSAKFDEIFSFQPEININTVVLSNHVAGFYMPCGAMTVHTTTGSTQISFELRRNRLIVQSAVLLLIVAAVFAIFISLFVETGPLPHALSSYFFAVWSIRALFGLTAEGFPTFFDLCIVSLVLFILLLLVLRGLGLRDVLTPLGRHGSNLVRRLEGRELLSAVGRQQ
jgi:hypothetical protein